MKAEEISQKACEKFTKLLTRKVEERITGSAYKKVYERPSRKFFVGTLCTQHAGEDKSILTKRSPFSMGVEILVKKSDIRKSLVRIKPEGCFYYRVFPNLEEQRDQAVEELGIKKEELEKKISADPQARIRMRKVFKKLRMPGFEISKNMKDLSKRGKFEETRGVIKSILKEVKKDPDSYLKKEGKEIEQSLPLKAIKDEKSFKGIISAWGKKEATPKWDFEIGYKVSNYNDEMMKITFTFLNSSKTRSSDTIENFIFETALDVKLEGAEIQDFIIDYLRDDYKYDGNVKGNGINSSVKLLGKHHIRTDHMPIYEQKKFKPSPIETRFEELSKDPLPTLKKISEIMKSKLVEFRKMGKSMDLTPRGRMNYEKDIAQFEDEVRGVDEGISLLERYPDVMRAFKLMNETFSLSSAKAFDSWWLFQIVFILMSLPDIAVEHHPEINNKRNIVDVIYFPTGGGKTEAYLGIVIFSAFFDRIRGKHSGVTAITKFPLRLLSLQQLQRIADLFAKAEIIRRGENDIGKKPNQPFSVGYYVGENNTPNVLVDKNEIFGKNVDYLSPLVGNPEEAKRFLIIAKCPFCDKYKVVIEPDVENTRLLHVCKNPECKEDILPVYITDVEIYRYLPTFIVSTLDKMAICGWQRNFRNIFGQVKYKCPKHGYTSFEHCVEKNCDVNPEQFEKVKIFDPTPSLLIQDEMHLVRESLGTFDSHYETFLIHYHKSLTGGKKEAKIITATATISEYELQTKHLYMKKARQFPSAGPSKTESFYAFEDPDHLSRLIIGVLPHDKTIVYAVLDVIQSIYEIIQNYQKNPEALAKKIDLTREETEGMLKYYSTILSYNLAKRRGDRINQSIATMVNPSLLKRGYREMIQKSLTGDVSFREIREVLNELESDESGPIDLITATSMISHGVDINRLNVMVFTEMPRNTAEYIQALSRVGRKLPGIVFVVMNPTMERDQSYYNYFEKFHEFRDMLIEAVPINRWAKFSINRTVPGIFSAAVLNYFDLKVDGVRKGIYLPSSFNQAIEQGKLSRDEIIDFVMNCYKVEEDQLGLNFRNVIQSKVSRYIDDIIGSIRKNFVPSAMHEAPMNSLRDIEPPVEITPTTVSYHVIDGMTVSKTRGIS